MEVALQDRIHLWVAGQCDNINYEYWNIDILDSDEFVEIVFETRTNRDQVFDFLMQVKIN